MASWGTNSSRGTSWFGHLVFRWLNEHVFERGTGGNHRENVVGFDALGMNQDRAIVVGEGFFDHASHVSRAFDVDARDAIGGSQFAEVRVADEIDSAEAIVEEKLLPLANHPEVMIVQYDDFDRQLVNRRGGELKQCHLESTVAGDRDASLVRASKLRTNRGRETEAHCAGST